MLLQMQLQSLTPFNLNKSPTPTKIHPPFIFTHPMLHSSHSISHLAAAVNLNPADTQLGNSVKKLSEVVSEEVPGTLSSLKLSSLELSDLTQQLSSLRHIISGVGIGNKDRSTMRSRSFRKKKPSS